MVNGPAHKTAAPESCTQQLREGCAVGQDDRTNETNEDAHGNEVGEDKVGDGSQCAYTKESDRRKCRRGEKGWESRGGG